MMHERTIGQVDKDWLKDRLSLRDWSMRRFADELGWDISQLSRAMNDKRDFRLSEVLLFASKLGVTPEELLPKLGFPDDDPGIPVIGTIDKMGELRPSDGSETIAIGGAIHDAAVALRISNAAAELEALEGGIMLCGETEQGINPRALGRLAFVRLDSGEELVIRVLRLVDKKTVVAKRLGASDTCNLTLDFASPVIALIP